MGIADKIRGVVQGVATEGTERAQALADARKRSKLIGELGDLTYRKAKGEAVDGTLIEAVISSIDELEADASPTDGDGVAAPGTEEAGGAAEDNGNVENP